MARLPVRDTCPANKQCSSTSTTTSLTSKSTSCTNTETTQTVVLISTSTLATSLMTTAAGSPAAASSVVASVKTTDHHGMVIGGVVGGVVGFLLLLGLALFLWCSRRKKPGQKVAAYALGPLGGLRSKHNRRRRPGLVTDARTMDRPRSSTNNTKGPSRPTPTRTLPTMPPTKPSPTKPSPTTRASPAGPAGRLPPSRQSRISPPLSGRFPNATTIHSARSLASTPTISSLTLSGRSLSINRRGTLSAASVKQLPPIPQHAALRVPPELSDTGFYRQRVELAASPSRELINRFDPRRQLCKSSEINGPGDVRPGGTVAARSPPRTGPVVTADGVVLTANFERTSCGDEILGSSGDSGPSHVMSFMQYDPEWNEVLPAYHPSWRERLKLGKIEES